MSNRLPKMKWESEAKLCAAMMAAAEQEGWQPYAETGGWDVLLVRKRDGFQVGVQAKLRLTIHVLGQAVAARWTEVGPDVRAVLVPEVPAGGPEVCHRLGVHIIRPQSPRVAPSWCMDGKAPRFVGLSGYDFDHKRHPLEETGAYKRHPLPEFIPDVAAGASAPVQLTDWKIAALKVCARLELYGFVTREDFKRLGIDFRRWFDMGWLAKNEKKPGIWTKGKACGFAGQHPKVYQQVLEQEREKPEGTGAFFDGTAAQPPPGKLV